MRLQKIAAANQLAERQLQYEVATAGAATRWAVVDEQLRAATIEAATAQQNYLSAAARLDRLSQRESELSSQLAAAATKHERSNVAWWTQTRPLSRHGACDTGTVDAAGQFAERQRELQASIDVELSRRVAVEAELAQTLRARDAAEFRHASAVAEFEARLRELETALGASRHDHESSAAEVDASPHAKRNWTRRSRTSGEPRRSGTPAHGDGSRFRDADERATSSACGDRKAAAREAELDGRSATARGARRCRARPRRRRIRSASRRSNVRGGARNCPRQTRREPGPLRSELSQAAANRDRLNERVGEVRTPRAGEERPQSAAAEVAG